jgi:hypothetical protein
LIPRASSTPLATWFWPTWVVELETCVGSHVHLVGAFISYEKNLYRLPFTPPLWFVVSVLQYGHPWAHYSSGYQDRLLGGPLGLLNLGCTASAGVERKDYKWIVLDRLGSYTCLDPCKVLLVVHD